MKNQSPLWVRALLVLGIGLGAVIMVGLGFWQLGRLQERRALNAETRRRLAQPPLVLSGQRLADTASLEYRPAVVRGVYDFSQEIVLLNRSHAQVPGVHVITPLRMEGSEMAVLVDRGWLPLELARPEARAVYHTPSGAVEVRGILRASQTRPAAIFLPLPADPPRGAEDPRLDEWYWLNIDQIQGQVSFSLAPMFIELTPSPGGTQLPIPDNAVDLSEGPHLGYAVQWFAFAAILVIGPLAYGYPRWRRRRTH
jgi:surfeit locus 1 family protein